MSKRGLLVEVGQSREESGTGEDPAGPVGSGDGRRAGRRVAGHRRGWTKERNVRSVARVCNILS